MIDTLTDHGTTQSTDRAGVGAECPVLWVDASAGEIVAGQTYTPASPADLLGEDRAKGGVIRRAHASPLALAGA